MLCLEIHDLQWNHVFEIWKDGLDINKYKKAIYFGMPLTFVMIICVGILI